MAETNETYAVRLMSSLIRGYVTLELAGSFDHSEPSSETTWPELLDDLDRTLADRAASLIATGDYRRPTLESGT